MRLRMGDRIVSALLGLLSTLLGVGVVLYVFDFVPHWRLDLVAESMPKWMRWAVAGVCVLLVILGLRGIAVLFRRRKDRGFVLQRMEYGDMSISMKALENMIRRCVEGHEALKLNNIHISRVREGISVDLRITLMGGANIPLTVNALQKQIKQYITSCSGIDVREVRVQVETDLAKLAPPQVSPVEELPKAEEPARLSTKHLWRHKEEPDTYGASAVPEDAPTVQAEEPVARAEEPSPQAEEPAVQAEEPAQAAPETIPMEEAVVAEMEEDVSADAAPFEPEAETDVQAQTISGEEQA